MLDLNKMPSKLSTSNIQSKLETLTDEIHQTKNNVKAQWNIIIDKYNLTESQQQILYSNIEKIVDVAISSKNIPKDQHTIIGATWSIMTSEYLKDISITLDNAPRNCRTRCLPISSMTEKEAREYFDRLLTMYELKDNTCECMGTNGTLMGKYN